jgi:predicted phage terminase large subunit-like protein
MKRGYQNNPPPILQCFKGFPVTRRFVFSKPLNERTASQKKKSNQTLREFIRHVSGDRYQWYHHCEVLGDVLQRVADGKIKRLLVFTPPRHGKSETISRLFTAYFLHRYPERWVGLSSYSADLANTLSRNARDNYRLAGNTVKVDAAGVQHWETGHGGGLWATGAGGPATGKGGHLLVVDDPVKNAEEAASEVIRAKLQDWWHSTWYTREEPWSPEDPNGAMIVVQTRWHEDDLSGWLLQQERESEDDEDRERWHIVNLPAIAEDPQQFPESCTVEPDWRQPGEALCPERRPIEKLEKIRHRISEYYFDALFQQRPSAREGEFFKVGKIEIVQAVPANLRRCRAWDLGATKDAGSYTSGVLIGIDAAGIWYVLDVVRGQWPSDDVRTQIRNTAIGDGPGVKIHLPQDPGQAGKDQGQQFIRFLAGFNVKVEPVTGSKETRADPFAAQWNAGNVKLLQGAWNKPYIEEYRQFPRGKFSDQVDSGSDAFTELALGGDWQQWKFRR